MWKIEMNRSITIKCNKKNCKNSVPYSYVKNGRFSCKQCYGNNKIACSECKIKKSSRLLSGVTGTCRDCFYTKNDNNYCFKCEEINDGYYFGSYHNC